MYYRKALELQSFLDMAKEEGTLVILSFCAYASNYNYNDSLVSCVSLFLQICWMVIRLLS